MQPTPRSVPTVRGRVLSAAALAILLLTSSCASIGKTEKGAIIGAGSGAVLGGVVGKVAGSTTKGAIIGAAIGGAAGAYIGHRMDDKARILRDRLPNAEVERVGEGILVTFDGGLLFDFDSSALRPEARNRLGRLVQSMSDMPNVDILVAGHTDSVGSEDYNYDLSLRRARSAVDYLASQGIDRSRLRMAGLGESEPVATNDTEAGRQQNRRIEVAVYANDQMKEEARSQAGA